jgi:hypothetical protein
VAAGEGKGWAKGRSAKDDPRIARAAARHRGMRYVSHAPPEQDRRRISPPVSTEWTPLLAYAVGLAATDGCVADGDHISFPSADRELVELFARCLLRGNRISEFTTRTGNTAFRIQFGDVRFCRWLNGIGITARKSLTIGALEVPDTLLLPLARGLLDGDGSIMNKRARADVGRRNDYYWEYLRTKFVSASRQHLEWLGGKLQVHLDDAGYLEMTRPRDGRHAMYALRYGKRASLRLLPLLYADPDAPRLTRKWLVWASYAERHGLDPRGLRT